MIGLNYDLQSYARLGKRVRIALIGAGQMGVDVVAETTMMRGVEVVATADIDLKRAQDAYSIARVRADAVEARNAVEADRAIAEGKRVYTEDFRILTDMQQVDVVLEATGVPEVSAAASIRTIRNRRHLAMMSVETDITVGPLLHRYAQSKGVLYALAAGDEPAACKELYDFAESLGFTVVAAGKGKNNPLDKHAKPTDDHWAKEAARRNLNPNMLIEFVDGSKTMIEMAAVSNATGLVPDVRGMHGPETNRDLLNTTFALKEHGGVLHRMGVVEYGVGHVAPGVFVIVTTDHPRLRSALILRDMGHGPYYTLFRPYHLCSIEVPLTCAMLVVRGVSNMFPLDRLVSEVIAVAKQNLKVGDRLDGIGGCMFYSSIDTFETARRENLLPIGLAKNARLIRPVQMDTPISWADVEVQRPSTVLELRQLQDRWMDGILDEKRMIEELDIMDIP